MQRSKVDFGESAARTGGRLPWLLVGSLALSGLFLPALAPGTGPETQTGGAGAALPSAEWGLDVRAFDSLRRAIEDARAVYGQRYSRADEFLQRLADIECRAGGPDSGRVEAFRKLRTEALLAHPELDGLRLLVVKRKPFVSPPAGKNRKWKSRAPGLELGMPSNHECNSSLNKDGYDNEIAVLSPVNAGGALETLYGPADGGYVGEIDLHWDGDRFLFTRSDPENWKIWEMKLDGSAPRQVSRMPADVDAMDPCYLPGGKIIFGSTASYQSVPCWHGKKWVSNLYVMSGDGSGVRQLCFDQDHDLHPAVLPNGQVIYSRWDYTGINHIYLRMLMVMNPDGTGQRAIYGSNSWYPNALYFPRALPGQENRLLTVLSGYHGPHRMGQLVTIDIGKGWYGAEGMTQRISGRGDPLKPIIRDELVQDDWPRFLHPFPLTGKLFVVACQESREKEWGIYLADVFDNLVPLRCEPGYALLEPVPLRATPRPPVIVDRTDPDREDATVYIHDVYSGPGLAGVPRGTIKKLRVVAYHFGYRELAGPDKVGRGGPWEVMRILGTAPVEPDGSASFRVPARTPLALQVLDGEGKAVQLMRSWFSAQGGENVSCIGCHEKPGDTAPLRATIASGMAPGDLTPWYGPPRGFDFTREVQPVLDRHCVSCHDGSEAALPDLRREEAVPDYKGLPLTKMGGDRLLPEIREATGGLFKYTPAYEALVGYVRRVGIEDDVSLLVPGEFHAGGSPLVQKLKKGHGGVRLSAEDWDRLVTWIDLNAPCHGTWGEVHPIPNGGHERRMAMWRDYGGPAGDPEIVPDLTKWKAADPKPQAAAPGAGQQPAAPVQRVSLEGWPWTAEQAHALQYETGEREKVVDLGGGVTMQFVRIPAGQFVMGDAEGEPDERPAAVVAIPRPFWMGACEVTNEQYRAFDPGHDARYYAKRHAQQDDQGPALNESRQPVVRVSWERAMAFCRWLSERTGLACTLPTEAQWEYACRAGTAEPLHFGAVEEDYTPWANLADLMFKHGFYPPQPTITGGLEHVQLDGSPPADGRFLDGSVVTEAVGSRRPNVWGLHDMHGNAAEWTRSLYLDYPYNEDDGRNAVEPDGLRSARGGSFYDPPRRCRSAYRVAYPEWQRVFNVGFRVVVETIGNAK